jgi:membrane protein YdbS with pleckstrin-like domain
MNSKRNEILLCLLALICAVLWMLMDYHQYGFSTNIFTGPALVLVLVVIPSLVSYHKNSKNKKK